MIQAELAIRNGRFARAAARVDGINTHIGYGVFLQRLGLDVRANPSFFEGTIGLSGGPKVPQKPPKPPIEAVSIDGAFSYLVADPGRLRVSGRMNFRQHPGQGRRDARVLHDGPNHRRGKRFRGAGVRPGITSDLAGFVDGNRSFLLEGDVRASVFGIVLRGGVSSRISGSRRAAGSSQAVARGPTAPRSASGIAGTGRSRSWGRAATSAPIRRWQSPHARVPAGRRGREPSPAGPPVPRHVRGHGGDGPAARDDRRPGRAPRHNAHRRQQPPPGRLRDPAAPIRPHDLHSCRQATRRPLEAAPRAGILRGQIRAHGVRAAGAASRGQGERKRTMQASLPRETAPWAGRPLPRGGPTDRAPARANHSEPRGYSLPARRLEKRDRARSSRSSSRTGWSAGGYVWRAIERHSPSARLDPDGSRCAGRAAA